jgi:hypothetical protein
MNNASLLRSWEAFHKWEEQLIASEPVDIERNFRLADNFYEYGRRLGKIPRSDPLEGLDVLIQMVKVFRNVHKAP